MTRRQEKLTDKNKEFDAATSYMVGTISAMPYDTNFQLNQQSLELIKKIQQMQNGIPNKKKLDQLIENCLIDFHHFEKNIINTGMNENPKKCKDYMNHYLDAKKKLLETANHTRYH